MAKFAYKCPTCGSEVDVAQDQVGNAVTCPNPRCGKPFRPEIPKARPVDDGLTLSEPIPDQATEVEQIIRVVHPAMRSRPFLLLSAVLLLVGGLIFAAMAWFSAAILPDPVRGTMPALIGLVVAAAGALWLALWSTTNRFQRLTITTSRTRFEEGFVSRDRSEVLHEHVRNLQVNQTAKQRVLNLGDLSVSSSAQDDFEIIVRSIPDPNGVAELIRRRQAG